MGQSNLEAVDKAGSLENEQVARTVARRLLVVMKGKLLWLIVVAALLGGFLLYRSWSQADLNVTPDAQREIDKAKRR